MRNRKQFSRICVLENWGTPTKWGGSPSYKGGGGEKSRCGKNKKKRDVERRDRTGKREAKKQGLIKTEKGRPDGVAGR